MSNSSTLKPVVVLGYGAAAVSAVLAMRNEGHNGPIHVVTDADPEPYSPVLTSYFAGGRIPRGQCNPWADIDLATAIDEVIAHAHIQSIDIGAREVALDDGRCLQYSKLLVATGAHPVTAGFPHIDGYRPHVLRTMDDAEDLGHALQRKGHRNILISGTSMVGLKALEACLDRGANVTLLGRSPHVLRTSAHPDIARQLELMLEQRGVKLHLGQTIRDAEFDERTRTCAITFDSEEREFFDDIILAQGVKPNLEFLPSDSSAPDQGLATDRFMHTTMPDVFAAGDVARTLDLSVGEARIAGLWQAAVQQGRCAGRSIAAELAGRPPSRPYPGFVPANVIHVRDVLFASAGSVREDSVKRIELRKENGVFSVYSWIQLAGQERLAGFNILSADAQRHENEYLDHLIGRCRSEIWRTYLDKQGGN